MWAWLPYSEASRSSITSDFIRHVMIWWIAILIAYILVHPAVQNSTSLWPFCVFPTIFCIMITAFSWYSVRSSFVFLELSTMSSSSTGVNGFAVKLEVIDEIISQYSWCLLLWASHFLIFMLKFKVIARRNRGSHPITTIVKQDAGYKSQH